MSSISRRADWRAVMASPRPTACAPRSQAMSPWRGSDPDSRGRRSSSPWARASSARSRSSQMSRITKPSSAGAVANRSIAASASATSPSAPAVKQCLHQNTGRRNAPLQQRPARNRSSAAARISRYGVIAISAPGPLPRRRRRRRSVPSRRQVPRARTSSLTSASSSCPRSRSAPSRCTSATPSAIRAMPSARSSPDRSAIRRASSISRTAESSARSTP